MWRYSRCFLDILRNRESNLRWLNKNRAPACPMSAHWVGFKKNCAHGRNWAGCTSGKSFWAGLGSPKDGAIHIWACWATHLLMGFAYGGPASCVSFQTMRAREVWAWIRAPKIFGVDEKEFVNNLSSIICIHWQYLNTWVCWRHIYNTCAKI